jgi:hypothetical protein
VRLAGGELEEVWVDTKTFLELKVPCMTYGPDGAPRMVPTLYRAYNNFEGLKIPTTTDRRRLDRPGTHARLACAADTARGRAASSAARLCRASCGWNCSASGDQLSRRAVASSLWLGFLAAWHGQESQLPRMMAS